MWGAQKDNKSVEKSRAGDQGRCSLSDRKEGRSSIREGEGQAPGMTVMFFVQTDKRSGGAPWRSVAEGQRTQDGLKEREGEKCSATTVSAWKEIRKNRLENETV